jgi:SAM-dependent methyltransferase/uncharacterized protein YbaR (Trm112 family)
MHPVDPELLSLLQCPRDQGSLTGATDSLECSEGHRYPVVHGVPVLLRPEVKITKPNYTMERIARNDLPEAEWQPSDTEPVHPAVQKTVGATSGYMYSHLINRLREYPIPEIRLPAAKEEELLLDIGCGWGRWTAAATRRGYSVIGLDPDIGLVLTARTVVRQLGLKANFVCADARYLPFKSGTFGRVFSYSVIQHFSKSDARETLRSISRVLQADGTALIQMPNKFGIRSGWHQIRGTLREAHEFDVRYWSPAELRRAFEETIGPSSLSVDCYFGLGLQPSDIRFMTPARKFILTTSELLRAISRRIPPFGYCADSLYVQATKTGASA